MKSKQTAVLMFQKKGVKKVMNNLMSSEEIRTKMLLNLEQNIIKVVV